MASNFLRKPSLGASPLQGLADYFEKARKRAGTIALPDSTVQTIKDYRAQGSEHSAGEVETIVRALEPSDSQLCSRLDSKGLVTICSVLVHSQTCLAQQRGLYLLAESIYTAPLQPESQSATLDQQSKKVAIGSAALSHLVKGFASGDNVDQTRRWMGVLALELLKDCPQNVAILKKDYTKLQTLAATIKRSQCQVLKLLAGSMINVMLNHGVVPVLIWTDKTDPSAQMRFPRAEQQDTQWVTSFEGYVEGLGFDDTLTQERSSVIFAYALSIGGKRYDTNEESAILVTVSQDLNIVIPGSATGPAMYIDIPLNAIGRIKIEGKANSQSQSLCFALTMQLRGNAGPTCYLNASAKDHGSIALAFVSEDDARTLEKLIQPSIPNEGIVNRLSVSQGIPVSQPYADEPSSSLAPQEDQIIATAASVASPTAQKPLHDMNQSQKLNHDTLNKTVVPKATGIAGEASRTMSVSSGINLSQQARTNNRRSVKAPRAPAQDTDNRHHPTATAKVQHTTMNGFQHSSDTDPSSSMRYRNGLDAIDNAPEFEEQPHPPSEEDVNVKSSLLKRQDHRSSHEALDNDACEQHAQLQQVSHIIGEGLDKSAEDELIENLEYTNESLNGQTTMRKQAAEASESDEEQKPSGIPQGAKLTAHLRDSNGSVAETPTVMESKQSAEIGAPQKAKLQKSHKEIAMVSAKTKSGVQKRTRVPKKAAKDTEQKKKAAIESLNDDHDEYAIQATPKSSTVTGELIDPQPQLEISKPAKKQSIQITKSRGTQQTSKQQPSKSKPKPAAPPKQRPTREAAKKANAKIQGVETNNNFTDTEQALMTANSPTLLEDDIGLHASANPNDHITHGNASQADHGKSHISSQANPKPEADGKASEFGCLSKSDEVALTADPPKLSAPETSTKSIANKPAAQPQNAFPGTLLNSRDENVPIKPISLRNDHKSRTDQQEGAAEEAFVPDSMSQSIPHNSSGKGKEDVADLIEADILESNHFAMIGETEDSHFQEALGDARDRASLSQVSTPPLRKSGRLAKASKSAASDTPKKPNNGKAAARKDHRDLQEHDLFEARLGSLVSPAKAAKTNPKQSGRWNINEVPSAPDPPNVKATAVAVGQPTEVSQQGHKMLRSLKQVGGDVQPKRGHAAVTTLQEPGSDGKRKLENEEDKKQAKKVKLSQHPSRAPAKRPNVGLSTNDKTPMPVNKKSELISWGASGPKNQGTTSGKTKAQSLPQDTTAKEPGQAVSEVRRSSKRKTAPYNDDPAPWEHDQPVKRQKAGLVTPSRSRQHVPKMMNEPTTAEMQGRAQRLTSQSSKVDMNGSPLPVTQANIQGDKSNEALDTTTLVFDEDENIGMLNDDDDASDPQLPTVSDNAKGQTADVPKVNVTSKGKQFPSSPEAASALTNHFVLESGEMVNKDTLESVVPTIHASTAQPKDPFVGDPKKPPSSFVRMLRKSKDAGTQSKSEELPDVRSSGRLKRKAAINKDEDPDQTLVEPQPQAKRRKGDQKAIVQASMSSQSSAEEGFSEGEEESEEEVLDAMKEWKKLLEPHQCKMIDILTVIAHRLVRHLVDRELVIKELLDDYKIEGKDLIDGYAKERNKILETDQGEIDQLKTAMSRVYLQAMEAMQELGPPFLRKKPKKTRASDDLQARLDEQQQKLRNAISAAAAGTFN